MHRLAPWMVIADVEFLALLAETAEPLPVAVVADHTAYPVDYVRRRCRVLAEEGLVQPVGADVYELRDLGAAFLSGDVRPERLAG